VLKKKHLDPSVFRHFDCLEDPRTGNALLHPLSSMIAIALCAVISGADSWVDIEDYGHAKRSWLQQILWLPHGIPSHDCFGRVFAALDADQFERCFRSWVDAIARNLKARVIAIDGKTARRSHDRRLGKRAVHMVSAWANEHHIVLGQVKTEDHSNEITAIPMLLKSLDIEGSVVTIDAMGCQKKVAEQILAQGGNYILALKENQPELREKVGELFAPVLLTGELNHHTPSDRDVQEGKGHGRLERRECWTIPASEWRFYLDMKDKWPGLQSVILVLAQRSLAGETTREPRYYISSLPPDAEALQRTVRAHWGVENGLHWVLDVAFREDESRVRKGNGQQNFSLLRRLALNLLRQAETKHGGIANRRKRAGWDDQFLLHVLNS